MGLIVFEGFFVLIFLSIFIFTMLRKDKYGIILKFISGALTLTALLLMALYILLYFEFQGFYSVIITKIIMGLLGFITVTIFYLSANSPYFDNKVWSIILTVILAIINIFVSVFFIHEISWNDLQGFYVVSTQNIFGFPEISGLILFAGVNYLIAPILFCIVLFVRLRHIRSNIYKQQLALVALSILLFAAIQLLLSFFSYQLSWLISFLPVGYLLLLMLLSYIFSLNVVLDKDELFQNVFRLIFFTFLFAIFAGLLTGLFLTYIRDFSLQVLAILASITAILFSMQTSGFDDIFRSSFMYDVALEKDLKALDFGKGRLEVIQDVVNALKNNVGCSTVDIFVADDKFNFSIDYSTQDNAGSFNIDTPAFQYIIDNNIQVLLHTEVITSYEFLEYKADLNGLFWKTHSDMILFVRDGQRLIGGFALGPRLKRSEYNQYDISVFEKFYSYFLLISYYLRNIAKQDVMITIDREIEMSDQIIGEIRESINKVDDPVISIDSVEFSAHKLGGDFIDFIQLADKKYFFLIGDVSGKGLSASMSMVILKNILRTYLEASKDFKELVVKLNGFIKDNLPRGTFFAGLFGILDLQTQTIYYLNCGIPLMSMYIKSYNNAIEIQGEGRVLGFVKNIAPYLKMRKITMQPHDIVVFTTDGLLDSENLRGDRFGKDRVASIVVQNNSLNSKQVADTIFTRVEDFVSKELQDDVTVLVFKHNGFPDAAT